MLPEYKQRRLKQMNTVLYPVKLKYREDRKTFFFAYRRGGHDIRKTLGTDIETAYEEALLMRSDYTDTPSVASRGATLADYHTAWRKKRESRLAASTVEIQRYYWQALSAEFTKKTLSNITKNDVKQEMEKIERDSMRGNVGSYLSSLFKSAVEEGKIFKAPWKQSKPKSHRKIPIITPQQAIELAQSCPTHDRFAVALAYFCGLSRAEIFGLTAGRVMAKEMLIDVQVNRLIVDGVPVEKQVKTERRRRLVPIPSVALPLIMPALEGIKPDEFIIEPSKGIGRRIDNKCKSLDLPKLGIHGLRHNCASQLVMKSGMAIAQIILGHSQIATTIDTYSHIPGKHLADEMNKTFCDSPDNLTPIDTKAENT